MSLCKMPSSCIRASPAPISLANTSGWPAFNLPKFPRTVCNVLGQNGMHSTLQVGELQLSISPMMFGCLQYVINTASLHPLEILVTLMARSSPPGVAKFHAWRYVANVRCWGCRTVPIWKRILPIYGYIYMYMYMCIYIYIRIYIYMLYIFHNGMITKCSL